jgi:periplasmic protein TonB
MIARAEMSTNAQMSEPQASSGPKGMMSVALIGPNDAHRQTVARALATAEGRKIHEFIDYPATLSDLARMMETKFDVVLVDVDTDESYALQIISKLAEFGPAVMAYSARTDEDLLKSCMRAGARDFLPLPSDGGPASTSAAPTPAPAAARPAPRQSAPQPVAKPVPAAIPVAPRSNVTPIVPEKRVDPAVETKPLRASDARALPDILKDAENSTTPGPEAAAPKTADDSEFAAWDAVNLRRASMPPVPKPDARPRPSLVPEMRKAPEPAPMVTKVEEPEPVVEAAPTPIAVPIERPPVSVDIFRSSMFQAEPSEAAEKQSANFMKWILIAAGPVVLALVLLVVFTRSSTPTSLAANAKQAPQASTPTAAATKEDDPAASNRLIVNATGKPGTNAQASNPKPSAAQPQAQTQTPAQAEQAPAPVSPDAMAAQLVAPTRIAGQIKKTAVADEPPPTAPSTVSLDDNNSVPGSVFGSGSKARVMPHVVAISAGVASGMILHKTAPVYPKFAQDAHITGTVVLKATITKQGTIEGIQVLSGPKLLAPSAVDAVKTWKYKPYMLDGQPVSVETNVTVVFGGRQ